MKRRSMRARMQVSLLLACVLFATQAVPVWAAESQTEERAAEEAVLEEAGTEEATETAAAEEATTDETVVAEEATTEETADGLEVADAILEIVEASGEMDLADREGVERLQEYIAETKEAAEALSPEEQTALSDSIVYLDHAAVSVDAMQEAMAQVEATGTFTIEQTGLPNSWRYINGEPIEEALVRIEEEADEVTEVIAESEAAEEAAKEAATETEEAEEGVVSEETVTTPEAAEETPAATEEGAPEASQEEAAKAPESMEEIATSPEEAAAAPETKAKPFEEVEPQTEETAVLRDLEAEAALPAEAASLRGTTEEGQAVFVYYEPTGKAHKGIDVSKWQGNINWSSVKASGIEFAILRCGYGNNDSRQDDEKWARNVSECERLGIPYGVYLYSYATSESMVDSEAQHVLRLLSGHSPSLPVYYDMEDNSQRLLGSATLSSFATRFCKSIRSAGYQAGVYASRSWWTDYLGKFAADTNFYHWVAEWSTICRYSQRYETWQYSSEGGVSGISGYVDMNLWYGDFPKNTAPITKSAAATPTPAPTQTPIPTKEPEADLVKNDAGVWNVLNEDNIGKNYEKVKVNGVERTVDKKYTGVAKNKNGWYFVRNGVYDPTYTGIAYNPTDGSWLRIEKGKVNWKFTGLARRPENGNWYYLRGGVLDWKYTGVAKNPANGQWFRVKGGKLDWTYTGIAKRPENGNWYYIKKGKLDWNFTGVAKRPENGNWYYIKKGQLDWSYTGIAKNPNNGQWFRIENGQLNWKFTGVAYRPENGRHYYIKKGKLDWTYSGRAKDSYGNVYTVRKGNATMIL